MESSSQVVSLLRQRMIEDMRMRKLCEKTQTTYIRAVRKFAAYLKRSPLTINAALTGLKFFFDNTLDCGELMAKMQPVRVPRISPVMLGREEVARLIAAAPNLKCQTALSIAYGARLRASEVIRLKVGDTDTDTDSERMMLRVEPMQGQQGGRFAILSPIDTLNLPHQN